MTGGRDSDLPAERDVRRLVALRRALHDCPEPAGRESATRSLVRRFLRDQAPDALLEQVGGASLVAVYAGAQPGPTLVVRCELDAVPVDQADAPQGGVSHRCGHDGHMAMVAGLALCLRRRRLRRGRVVLLFQSGEENATGAMAASRDVRYASLRPDYLVALHNLPGFSLGQLVLRPGVMCCASRGLEIELIGAASHAAHPERGLSPALGLARLIEKLSSRSPGNQTVGPWITVVGARLGERHFGTTPAHASLWVTLRTATDGAMTVLTDEVVALMQETAGRFGLRHRLAWHDVFPAVVNHARACRLVRQAAAAVGLPVTEPDEPFRWSEDFGHLAAAGRGVLFGLGSGCDCPQLHREDYWFPEELIPLGVRLFRQLLEELGL
jgi:amidohydrolase